LDISFSNTRLLFVRGILHPISGILLYGVFLYVFIQGNPIDEWVEYLELLVGLLFTSVLFLFLSILLALWMNNFWTHPWFVHVGSGFFLIAGSIATLSLLWDTFSTLTVLLLLVVLTWVLFYFHTEYGWKSVRSKVAFWALHFKFSHKYGVKLKRLEHSPIIIERSLLNQLQTYIGLSVLSFCVHLTMYFF
jgi:hypothetical protein